MKSVLADTHALLWFLFNPRRLSPTAKSALDAAADTGGVVCASMISVIEVRYLVEKNRIAPESYDNLVISIHDSEIALSLLPIDLDVALAVERIPRDAVPDLPDRIIAATALSRNLPLVTADHRIRASRIPTIW
jgi:PIN domain nuclease of toxin-antitoxin system